MANSFVTPLRYPGGKGRLGAWLSEIIHSNGLSAGTYAEPYAGGAGAAMYLLIHGHIDKVEINDVDPVIYAFWWSVINDTERFVDLILRTPVTIDEWKKQKKILLREDIEDKTSLGFAAFFLNRTNRSGIIRGGVIGGQNQAGNYKLDARYNPEGLVTRVMNIAERKQSIKISNLDALDFVERLATRNDVLIYLDPPYYKKGGQLYRNSYTHSDHVKVADVVKNIRSPWIVTYDNCCEITSIYDWANSFEFSLYYSTHIKRPVGKEVCFYDNIRIEKDLYLKR
ncbi:DNA adenine methylase [Halomonas sp. BN3-1]|uniref:DNA adenine methylase n=1 Tax=Halomonas sp. BN3-1 TaxID=2082393 RepID=UPI000D37EBB8|nr:DNA adenine methylase [Halomonas sp. BN3-1]